MISNKARSDCKNPAPRDRPSKKTIPEKGEGERGIGRETHGKGWKGRKRRRKEKFGS